MITDNVTISPSLALPRHLPLVGASNFRDLGGYATQDGHIVRWRRLFRSDHLAALTEGDRAILTALRLNRVCDFRGVSERAELVCSLPDATVHSLAIEPTVVQGMKALFDAGESVTAALTVDLMKQTYRDFVLANSPRFADMFAYLLADDSPLVFHCTAGKDRTGFAAALILSALGVSWDVVMEDYMLTNTHYQMPERTTVTLSQDVLNVLWRVQEGFLEAAFDAVDTEFGGVGLYLKNQLGLDALRLERLRELYLQKL
jgi:protein-tyrosine phosphatase